MLKPKNKNDSIYKEWETNGSIKKRELLEILKEVGDDDEIRLNVTAGEMCNEASTDMVSLFKYTRHEGEHGLFELGFYYKNEV